MRTRLTTLIWNLCPWQLLKEHIRFSFTIYISFINCKPVFDPAVHDSLQRIIEMTSFLSQLIWISQLLFREIESHESISQRENMLIPTVLCLLKQHWETKMLYHKIMSYKKFSLTMYVVKIHMKTGLIYSIDIKWENILLRQNLVNEYCFNNNSLYFTL